MPAPRKRVLDHSDDDSSVKRPRTEQDAVHSPVQEDGSSATPEDQDPTTNGVPHNNLGSEDSGTNVQGKHKGKAKAKDTPQNTPSSPKLKIRKLAVPRPFPTVPASVSATGPRSAHTEGKNYICITRKTPLGGYLRRCKDVFLKDGYKTLHLSAMGAAIPHLMQLALSLPPILPYAAGEVHTEFLTGTVDVQDEVIPEDEDRDIYYRKRGKSTVSVVIRVGDGVDEIIKRGKGRGNGQGKGKQAGGAGAGPSRKEGNGGGGGAAEQVIIRDEDMDHGE